MKTVFSITIKLKLASPEELKKDSKNLLIGQPFWLRSKTEEVFEGPYLINEETDPFEIGLWLHKKMIFIPICKRNKF